MREQGVIETVRGFNGQLEKLVVPKGKELFLPLLEHGEDIRGGENLLEIQVWATEGQWAWLEKLFLYWNSNFTITRTEW